MTVLVIRGGTVVRSAGTSMVDVLIDGTKIGAVGPDLDPPTGAEILDATGTLVLPGAIDVHTHFDLPVGVVRSADDFASGTVAAACGGTTCVVDFAGAGREPPGEALAGWHAKADGRAAVDYGFHLTVTSVPEDPIEAASLFAWFREEGVTSVKLYLAYPDRLMVDDATLARALVAGRRTGVLVCVHSEDGLDVVRRTAEVLESGERGPAGLIEARPAVSEAAAVRRVVDLVAEHDAPAYVVHLSSAAGLEEVRNGRARDARIYAETCPQYLFLTDDLLRRPREQAQDFVCTPPVRTPDDGRALRAALGDGAIDVVATDHCPFTRADRRRGTSADADTWVDFTGIPGGLPGVEPRLSLLYQCVREGTITLERWVDLAATTPARLFGMAGRKGDLAPGLEADVVLFDPDARHSLDPTSLHMRTDHSPYAGITLTGWPALTLSRGRIVARDGEPVDDPIGHGRYVRRRGVRL